MTESTLPRSSARDFGHAETGFAVEMNLNGFAWRSLTVETREEAEMIKRAIESEDSASGVRVVRDA
jgi:hypothetical protein